MTPRRKILSGVLLLVVVTVAVLAVMLSRDAPCGVAQPLPANTPSMQAAVYRCYGSPDVVKLEPVPRPTLDDDRMLVKVHAASVNPLDWHYMRGKPYIMRASAGMGTPEDIRLGVDFAGTVEAVGKNVQQFKPGDAVFGGADGSFAQYVKVRAAGSVAAKPANLTFEQAAAVPVAAITALQALRDEGKLQAGQRVLVNGASGGVGTFAVQIAKALGAEVTAVCSTRNVETARSIGADRVIDYSKEDFTRGGPQRYDLIIDNVGSHSLSEYRRVLTPKGILVIVGAPSNDPWLGPLTASIKAAVVSPFVSQKLSFFLADLNQHDLNTLGQLAASGKLTPIIDRRYPLDATAAAIRYVEEGHSRGKVVITVDSSAAATN